jgi:hypothetical protein
MMTAMAQKPEAQKPAAEKPAVQKPAASKPAAQKPAAKPVAQKVVEPAAPQPVATGVIELAGWVMANDDNRGYPFAIIDKTAAEVLVFGADGKLMGRSPALIGSAVGDLSAEGIADRELKDIPDKDRTTPAGRFIAGYGPATGGQRVLWVDYETAVSIHPMTTGNRAEKREERLKSATPKDNRITHGCINVSTEFYNKVIKATFGKGGVFYVLPDEMTMAEAFPGFADPNFAETLVGAYRIANVSQATEGR